VAYFDNDSKTEEWFLQRRAKLTCSENFKLLPTSNQSKDKVWSATAMTYIEMKAIEMATSMWERPEMDSVESLLHGKVYEYPAYERYVKETKNYSMVYMGTEAPMFIPHPSMEEESGGTPDVANITDAGSIDYLGEIKCPSNPAYHFRRLRWKDQYDIKENYLSCYTQMQNLMLITGAMGCDFVSYDERQLAHSKKIKIIEVKPDRKFIDNLELRIHLAVKEKYKILSAHMGVELKCKQDYLDFINS
jgi:hypothetical protein